MKFFNILMLAVLAITLQLSCTTTPEPVSNDVSIRLAGNPDHLSIYQTTSGYSRNIGELIFPTLLHVNPVDIQLAPVIGKALPATELLEEGEHAGAMRYTFEILDEAVWDDGSPVLASDYAFVIKAIMSPHVSSPYKSYYKNIKAHEPDPANPKKFSVTYPVHILGAEIVGGVYMMPEYVYDPEKLLRKYSIEELIARYKDKEWIDSEPDLKKFGDNFNDNKYKFDKDFISSCGAYKVESFVADQKVVLSKKKNWWGDALVDKYPMLSAYPERIIFKPITDFNTALTALKNEELDVMSSIPSEDFIKLKANKAITHLDFHTPQLTEFYHLTINTLKPALSDVKTRKALAHLFDLDEILDVILHGMGSRLVGPILSEKSYYNKSLKLIDYNPETAGRLLAEAGWSDSDGDNMLDKTIGGQRTALELDILYSTGSVEGLKMITLFQEKALKQGVKINLIQKEFNTMRETMKKKEFDLLLLRKQVHPGLDNLMNTWHSTGSRNNTGFGNAESDKLLEQIEVESNKQKRDSMYLRFQELVYDAQPMVFLYTPKERIATHKRFDPLISNRRPGYFENYFKLKP